MVAGRLAGHKRVSLAAAMVFSVHDTRQRAKVPFTPAQRQVVRIYTCGLTVYAPMHIGHARTYCFWDTFRRWLEYRGYHVISVINYTDIDDRIMALAPDGGWQDLCERMIAGFRRDCRALAIKDYAVYTRATDFVPEQIEAVARLIAAGHAYVVEGEVFYDVRSFPGYGQLSGNGLAEQQVGASGRVHEDFARKRHPADFTLWKPSGPGQPSWSTGHPAWPQGRPGWHIECSAMSTALLGEHFDVHGGGIDNLFPHHENELAQSEPLCGHPWVRHWMHPEHLDLRDAAGESVKMSKSLGNVIGVPELLGRHAVDEVRWFYASTHYRTKLAFSWELLAGASEGFRRVKRAVALMEARLAGLPDEALRYGVPGGYASLRAGDAGVPRERPGFTAGSFGAASERFIAAFMAAMDDDLATPSATAAIYAYVGELFAGGLETSEDLPGLLAAYRCLLRHLHVLGVELGSPRLYPELAAESMVTAAPGTDASAGYTAVIDRLVQARQEARARKDFARADLVRELLAGAGVVIEDTAKGPRWQMP